MADERMLNPRKVIITDRGKHDAVPKSGLEVVTPPNQPNIEIEPMHPVLRVAVRFARVYLFSFLGFLGVATAAGTIPGYPTDMVPVPLMTFVEQVKVAAQLAIPPTVVSLLVNAVEILTRLDERKPELRA